MNKKFKFRWSIAASSIMLALFSFGVGGDVKADNTTVPAKTQVTAVNPSSTNNSEQSSLHNGDNSQWALQSSSQSAGSLGKDSSTENSSTTSASASSDTASSSSSTSNGDTTTTYGNADDNNLDGANSSSASSASSSSSSSEPMMGLGDKGSAAAGTGADKVIKKIIDKVVPGGGLDNTKPDVPPVDSSTGNDQQSANQTTNQATGSGKAAATGNSNQVSQQTPQIESGVDAGGSSAVAQSTRRTAIEKSNAANALTHNSFANRVSKSDHVGTQKSNAKLVSFDTFSNLFYKQALNQKKNPGKFTTSKGKKVTITTPVSNVKYTNHDVNGVIETLPVIITLSIIGIVAVSFIVFDPLRFIFK
ncbi:hypothetical protein ACFQ22_04555 [Lentilactobacillus raoultii]|uniref:Uncharacterized protein n=1 Tax=Lentilactobacillus raoultii TaxID=1987503 RepID=A0ABW3PJY4_9LACO|nr:hypothetical protein [Lentilactobacillus raoultii]